MPLTITGALIASDRTTHTARLVPGRPHAGHVTWLPGRLLDRSSAVTATLADAAAGGPRPRSPDLVAHRLPGRRARPDRPAGDHHHHPATRDH